MIDQTEVREARLSDDLNFLFSTWLLCYKHESYFAKRIRNRVYFPHHQAIINHIIRRPGVKTLLIHVRGEPNVYLGYLVAEPESQVIHFAFIKREFQRMGLFRKLVQAAGLNLERCQFTHWTFDVDSLIEKFPGLTYNPYRL